MIMRRQGRPFGEDTQRTPDQIVSLRQLQPGMVVRHKSGGEGYIVTANYGTRVTAVRTQGITNPQEWEIVSPGWQVTR